MIFLFFIGIGGAIVMSYFFGIVMDGGCPSIWYGFPFGLTTAAILYLTRFRKTMRRY